MLQQIIDSILYLMSLIGLLGCIIGAYKYLKTNRTDYAALAIDSAVLLAISAIITCIITEGRI